MKPNQGDREAPSACLVCASETVTVLLAAGPQPLGNRFLGSRSEAEYLHPLVTGYCGRCGLVQIVSPVPAAELRPRFEWITYREPEGHLDRLVDTLAGLPGLTRESVICGVSYKDDTTLSRFRERGFGSTWRVDATGDLGAGSPRAEMETVQELLTPERAAAISTRHPRPALVVARHILEHAHDPRRFVEALRLLAGPSGYIVFEVPDCRRSLDARDYTVLWEEHVLSFTPETLRRSCGHLGLSPVREEVYPYPCEDSLVVVTHPGMEAGGLWPPPQELRAEADRAEGFAADFIATRLRWRHFLRAFREREGMVALLGAGHQAATFINLLGLGGLIEFVVDDNPAKAGLFMPGSRLPIRPSEALDGEGIRLCLLAVSAAAEDRVICAHQRFVDGGGRMASIFPLSPSAPHLPERG